VEFSHDHVAMFVAELPLVAAEGISVAWTLLRLRGSMKMGAKATAYLGSRFRPGGAGGVPCRQPPGCHRVELYHGKGRAGHAGHTGALPS
jgi:hypothetical protein